MRYCSNCGTELNDGAKFCPNCGTHVGGNDRRTPTRKKNDSNQEGLSTWERIALGVACFVALSGVFECLADGTWIATLLSLCALGAVCTVFAGIIEKKYAWTIAICSSFVVIMAIGFSVDWGNKTKSKQSQPPTEQKQKAAPEVGTLTAYYAKEDFSANDCEFKKGKLICDSNDPFNHITEADEKNYRYTGDYGGEEYSWLLPRSKVEKKTYKMNQLTPSDINGKAYFVAENGCVARIFWSNSNGHRFYNWNGKEEKYKEEEIYKECFVISAEFLSSWDNSKYLFEEQLNEKLGNIELYCENKYRQYDHHIGFVEEGWYNKEGYGFKKSAYDKDGKLLVDQWEVDGIPEYISIAYIAEEDALYINGTLYCRCPESEVTAKGLSLVANIPESSNNETSNIVTIDNDNISSEYSRYFGKWSCYIVSEGQRAKVYSATIFRDLTAEWKLFMPDGSVNTTMSFNQCVFQNGFVYFTDNGDISIKGTPRFRLGPNGLQTVDGDDLVKE